MSKTKVTAREVREFFQASEKRMAALSPEAQHTVREGARGRLHAEAVKVHNQRRRTRQYETGASREAAYNQRVEAQSLRAQAQAAGFTGTRGPLPKEFLASLSKG